MSSNNTEHIVPVAAADHLRRYLRLWQALGHGDHNGPVIPMRPLEVMPPANPQQFSRDQTGRMMDTVPIHTLRVIACGGPDEVDERRSHASLFDTMHRAVRSAALTLHSYVDGVYYLRLATWACQSDAVQYLQEVGLRDHLKFASPPMVSLFNVPVDVEGWMSHLLNRYQIYRPWKM